MRYLRVICYRERRAEVGEELHKKGTTENIKRLATLCELCPWRVSLWRQTLGTHTQRHAQLHERGFWKTSESICWLEAAALQLARAAPTSNPTSS